MIRASIPLPVLAAILVILAPDPGMAGVNFDFEQRYFIEPGSITTDHAILHGEGEFHLYYTVGRQGEGWIHPGNMVDFGHASSPDLIHWTIHPRILPTEAPGWKERNVWAPEILNGFANEHLLFYTGVDSTISQQIGVATSSGFFNWSDYAGNPIYHPDTTWADWELGRWANCRDPFVMRLDASNEYAMLTTALTKAGYMGYPTPRGAIALAFGSPDLGTWTDAGAPMFVNDTVNVIESTYLVERQGSYYLFYNEGGVPGIHYMTSSEPFSGWDKTTAQLLEFEGIATEIFEDGNGWLFARVRDAMWDGLPILGIKIDELLWAGQTPTVGPQNTMLDDWTIVSGNAFDLQPTFGDRPGERSGIPSRVEGLFWISTAEQHAGPLAWGCPECPPDESRTGTLRSRTFRIENDYLALRVGGGEAAESLYVSLNRVNAGELFRATGRNTEEMWNVVWDLRGLRDEEVYLEIVDLRGDGPMGHLNVDWIRETDSPPNQEPMAVGDAGRVNPGATTEIDVLANDFDPDPGGSLDPSTVAVVGEPAHGTIESIDPTSGAVTYRHDGSATLSDSFTYTVDDNAGGTSNAATVSITLNQPPVAVDDAATAIRGRSVVVDVVANDFDPDGAVDPGTVTVVSQPANGAIASVHPQTGAITYTHDGSTTISDWFTYTVSDNEGLPSSLATVSISITVSGCPLPTEGLVLHLEADSGVLAVGDQVTAWRDQSGLGNDLSAAGDPRLVTAGGPGEAPYIQFDGSGDKLERIHWSHPLSGFPTGSDDRTMFTVVRYLSPGPGGLAYGMPECGYAFGLTIGGFTPNRLTVQRWCNDFVSPEIGTGAGWISQAAMVRDSNLFHYRDGTLIASAEPIPRRRSLLTELGRLVVGAQINSFPYLTMDTAAILLYDRALAEGERQQVENYLREKYFGVPCGELTDFVAAEPEEGICVSTATPCVAIPVSFRRSDPTPVRGYTVTISLDPELRLCDGPSSITEGSYLSAVGPTEFQVVDNGGGSYTVHNSILGSPCGATGDGHLMDLEVATTVPEGTGLIVIDQVSARDCADGFVLANAGNPAPVPIDAAAPAAISDLVATQVKSGNDADGTTAIRLVFTAPGDAEEIEVYRAPFGNYPEYDDGPEPGSEPPLPAAYPPGSPWELAGSVIASGDADEPNFRDFYYYVAYARDPCDNVSPVSNMTGGTLNYHLGDVSDGSLPGNGDNRVDIVDVSALDPVYGDSLPGDPDPRNFFDIGPTSDGSVDGRPLTDNWIDFEDLAIIAMNFAVSGFTGPGPELADPSRRGTPTLALENEPAPEGLLVRLILVDNPGTVKAIHARIDHDRAAMRLTAAEAGALLASQGTPFFFRHLDEGGMAGVHAAVLGQGLAIQGSGEIARLRFRGSGKPELVHTDLRDLENRHLIELPAAWVGGALASPELPARFELLPAQPNPFNPSTVIRFRLPEPTTADLRIYDIRGKLVRTLVRGDLPPGEHAAFWDGRTERGSTAGSGVYLVRLKAGRHELAGKLQLIR